MGTPRVRVRFNIKYAVLIIFVAAAVLTPSSDPWNQTVFAAPMLILYLISIGLAWLVSPTTEKVASANPSGSKVVTLVFAAEAVARNRRARVRARPTAWKH